MSKNTLWATVFVLLWGSGAIVSKWGLEYASASAFLLLRFTIAFGVLSALNLYWRCGLPRPGTRWQVAVTGALLIGSYSVCYFLALDYGITPGVLATVMGVQPMLTLALVERRFAWRRLLGLAVALAGLTLVVLQSLVLARFSVAGMLFALAALAAMTAGAILQKRSDQSPLQALPIQYGVSLLLCIAMLPLQPFTVEFSWSFLLPLLWLGLIISVVAQLLLYRLIQAGNLVDVTSLFYLVPAVTAVMDYLFFGNLLSLLSLAGMIAIVVGLVLVFKIPR